MELDWHVRGMQPWPGAFTEVPLPECKGNQQPLRLMVLEVSLTGEPVPTGIIAGQVRIAGDRLFVATGDEWLQIVRIKPAGKNEMSVAEWLRGRPIREPVTLR
jgi:methionyl-tRNA formyltransferase